MHYVKHYNQFGEEVKEIPCILGSGAPTATTESAVGCLYMDTDSDNGDLYKCIAQENGVYTWAVVAGSGSVGADGEDGGYYKPSITQPSTDKMRVEFAASKSDMPSVAPVNITLPPGPSGPAGADGADGYTPVKGVDYFDGKDGAPGKDGSDGKPGADGYTPAKGIDYFTDEDVAGIVSQAANDCSKQMSGVFAPNSHVSDKNNPHGVTPSQIGAAPANSNYMLLGVEYLTQDYWNGYHIYTKMIAFSPNKFTSQTVSLPHEIVGLNVGLVVDVLWKYINASGNVTWRRFPAVYYGNVEWSGQAYFEGDNNIKFELGAQARTNMAASTDNIYVTLRYTKL